MTHPVAQWWPVIRPTAKALADDSIWGGKRGNLPERKRDHDLTPGCVPWHECSLSITTISTDSSSKPSAKRVEDQPPRRIPLKGGASGEGFKVVSLDRGREKVILRKKERVRGVGRGDLRDDDGDSVELARDLGERFPCDLWREKKGGLIRVTMGVVDDEEKMEEVVRFDEGERSSCFTMDMIDRGEGVYTVRSMEKRKGKRKDVMAAVRRGGYVAGDDGASSGVSDTEGSEAWVPIIAQEFDSETDELLSLGGSWMMLPDGLSSGGSQN
ncbi:hypothetical protein QBC44DRAFT_306579 [Cladorrhinum sp. PSN332]|nr:hypothetical protein QBC44DRAFT_306579 [Cladorrhinum sp. PSN332]